MKLRTQQDFTRSLYQTVPHVKKGFTWRYRYCIDSQHKSISSTDLNKLKEKVLEQDLEWKIIDEEKAQRSLDLDKRGIL